MSSHTILVAVLLLARAWPLDSLQLVINTWPFTDATEAGWAALVVGGADARLNAVERGCSECEEAQCDGSVGYGSIPDSEGHVTLDAMIMDGPTHDVGSVAGLRNVREAISVARAVMTHTSHSLLVGDKAGAFARMMGFEEWEGRSETVNSIQGFLNWRENDCQPNYYRGLPGAETGCPPYAAPALGENATVLPPATENRSRFGIGVPMPLEGRPSDSVNNHDTIGMIALDENSNLAIGTSTNGMNNKVAGRVGDTAIIGAGGYVENGVGAAVGTGDGDILMRFAPAARAVWAMGAGLTPTEACEAALAPIGALYPDIYGALVCADSQGNVGAAVWGGDFSYSWRTEGMDSAKVVPVEDMRPKKATP